MKTINEKIDRYLGDAKEFVFDKKKADAARPLAKTLYNRMNSIIAQHELAMKDECMALIDDAAKKDEEKYILWALKNLFRNANSYFFDRLEKEMSKKHDVEYNYWR